MTESSSDQTAQKRPRPLSPHLLEYKQRLTGITSILHRITGVGLVIGLAILTVLLFSAANDAYSFEKITRFLATPFGLVIVTGFVAAMCYHLCAGIRHLIFDTGAMLDLKNAYRAGYTVIGGTIFLTIALMFMIHHAVTEGYDTCPIF